MLQFEQVHAQSERNFAILPATVQYRCFIERLPEMMGRGPVGFEDVLRWRSKEKAEAWFLDHMDEKTVPAKGAEAAAQEEGFKRTTLQSAKKWLGIASKLEVEGWVWLLVVSDVA